MEHRKNDLWELKFEYDTQNRVVVRYIYPKDGGVHTEYYTYNGQTYHMEPLPDHPDSFSEQGAVRNFTSILEGRTFILRHGDDKWQHRYELRDIPPGRYMVTATLKKEDGDLPLKIRDWYKRDDLISEFQLDFIPKPADGADNSVSIVIGY